MKKLKIKLLRLFHDDTLAHMKAEYKRNKKRAQDIARLTNWFHQAREGWGL